MTSPGGQTWPIEILTPDEVRQLIRACSAKAPTGIRNRALIVHDNSFCLLLLC